jgi:hypothetical protein
MNIFLSKILNKGFFKNAIAAFILMISKICSVENKFKNTQIKTRQFSAGF